jgi:hypothetical protein
MTRAFLVGLTAALMALLTVVACVASATAAGDSGLGPAPQDIAAMHERGLCEAPYVRGALIVI